MSAEYELKYITYAFLHCRVVTVKPRKGYSEFSCHFVSGEAFLVWNKR
jgi:hypothetical protein